MKTKPKPKKCRLWYWWSFSTPKSGGPSRFVESDTGSRRGAEMMRQSRRKNGGQTTGRMRSVLIHIDPKP